MKKVLFIFGTRPEAIKLAPVVHACRERRDLKVRVLVTAQHKEMLYQVLSLFQIEPDLDLDIMRPRQSLAELSANLLGSLNESLAAEKPDVVVVQGDTTTTFVGALSAFYLRIPVAHVEAGLRSGNKYHPFPEELNRVMTGSLADLHFAPTETSRLNLLAEGVDDKKVFVVGNTVIDSLNFILKNSRPRFDVGRDFILVTAHRRENWGRPIENLCESIKSTAAARPDLKFLFSVHKNPAAREPVERILSGVRGVQLLEAPDYDDFAHMLNKCRFVLSDSGGVQEEGPALGKPVLVFRQTTERPEGVEAGAVKLIGSERADIERAVTSLLDDPDEFARMSGARSLYGNGDSAGRIAKIIAKSGSSSDSERPGRGRKDPLGQFAVEEQQGGAVLPNQPQLG